LCSSDATIPTWQELEDALKAVTAVVQGLVEFTKVRINPLSGNTLHLMSKIVWH
jgi:hypothetical protein